MYTIKLKNKILTHILKNGQKKTGEKIIKKCFKSIQKLQKKSHREIVKQAILNSTSFFRIITLKNNKRKKKTKKEIPAFFSAYIFRTSWSIKNMTNMSDKNISTIYYFNKLKQEILLNAKKQGDAVKTKNELHNETLKKKTNFKYYRW